ncbi:MAG: hypothetical protein ACRC0F_01780 [Cetobacterium sp.]
MAEIKKRLSYALKQISISNFIGPSEIKIGDLLLGMTLESNPTKVTFKKDVTEIKPSCKGGAVAKSITKVTSIVAETSVLFTADLYNKLVAKTGFDFNKDFNSLTNVNVKFKSDEVLELYECNVKIDKIFNFKKNTVSEMKLTITALKTANGYYKIGGSF